MCVRERESKRERERERMKEREKERETGAFPPKSLEETGSQKQEVRSVRQEAAAPTMSKVKGEAKKRAFISPTGIEREIDRDGKREI